MCTWCYSHTLGYTWIFPPTSTAENSQNGTNNIYSCFCCSFLLRRKKKKKSISLFSRWRLAVNSHNYRSELVIIRVCVRRLLFSFGAQCFFLCLSSIHDTQPIVCVSLCIDRCDPFTIFIHLRSGFLVAHCNSTIESEYHELLNKISTSTDLTVFGAFDSFWWFLVILKANECVWLKAFTHCSAALFQFSL